MQRIETFNQKKEDSLNKSYCVGCRICICAHGHIYTRKNKYQKWNTGWLVRRKQEISNSVLLFSKSVSFGTMSPKHLQRDDVGVRQMDQASKDLVRLQPLLLSPTHFWFQSPSCKDATIPIGSSHPTNPPFQKRGGTEATPWFRRMLPWDMPAYHYHVVSPIQAHPRDSDCFFILQSTNPKTEPSSSPKY